MKTSDFIPREEFFFKEHGFEFNILEKSLGNGSYGKIFEAEDRYKNKLAVKICSLDKHFNPLEASIMNTYIDNNINRSIVTILKDNKIYFFQLRAMSDLYHETKNNKKISLRKLFTWCYQIARGLYILHQDNIIHGDLKANNLLLFEDNTVKITDFSLSRIDQGKNKGFVCSSPYRPLECFLEKKFSKKVDIWALGCTFYEIAYGERLFYVQREDNKKCYINAILDWAKRKPFTKEIIDLAFYKNDFIPFKLSNEFNKKKMELFNDLILKMLVVDEEKRFDIVEVLQHPFFNGSIKKESFWIDFPLRNLTEKELIILNNFDSKTKKMLFEVISRIETELEENKIFSLKLLIDKIIEKSFIYNTEELEILSLLNFRIHKCISL